MLWDSVSLGHRQLVDYFRKFYQKARTEIFYHKDKLPPNFKKLKIYKKLNNIGISSTLSLESNYSEVHSSSIKHILTINFYLANLNKKTFNTASLKVSFLDYIVFHFGIRYISITIQHFECQPKCQNQYLCIYIECRISLRVKDTILVYIDYQIKPILATEINCKN